MNATDAVFVFGEDIMENMLGRIAQGKYTKQEKRQPFSYECCVDQWQTFKRILENAKILRLKVAVKNNRRAGIIWKGIDLKRRGHFNTAWHDQQVRLNLTSSHNQRLPDVTLESLLRNTFANAAALA